MNTQDLINTVRRRCPDYDEYEILQELNHAYSDIFETIQRTDQSYYEDTQTVTVKVAGSQFDLLWNSDRALSAAVSPLIVNVARVRVKGPGLASWSLATPMHQMSPQVLSQQANASPANATSSPYFYRLYGKGTIQFGLPVAVNTQIEISYVFAPLPLAVTREGALNLNGQIVYGDGLSPATTTYVEGTDTFFTHILPVDFRASRLAGEDMQADVSCELIVKGDAYRVRSINTDELIYLMGSYTLVSDEWQGSNYTLAVVPDFPDTVHQNIANSAIRNLFLIAEGPDGQGFAKWSALCAQDEEALVRNISERQSQRNPRKIPFRRSRRVAPYFISY